MSENDDAYGERNTVVALLAALFPSWKRRTDIPGWDPEWHGCVYVQLPSGQVSFHFRDSDAALFADVPEGTPDQTWDGHDKAEALSRIRGVTALIGSVGREATKLDAIIRIAEHNYRLRRLVREASDKLEEALGDGT